MISEKHSPGPWIDDESGTISSRAYNLVCEYGRVTKTGHRFIVNKEDRANAQLICAAPELLEVAKAAEDFVVGIEGAQAIWEQLRVVIRKATGRGK